MRSLLLMLLHGNREIYEVAILWHMRRRHYDVGIIGSISPREARDEIFNELTVDLLASADEMDTLTPEEAHHYIRRRIDSIIQSRHLTARNRRRIWREAIKPDAEASNIVVLTQELADRLLQRDFIVYLEKVDPSLVDIFLAVMQGYNRPLDIVAMLDIEQTDADYALKKLRRALRRYLGDHASPSGFGRSA